MQSWLYLWYAVALTVLVTWLNPRKRALKMGDYRAYLLYFSGFFVLMAVIPSIAMVASSADPGRAFVSVGLTFGRWRVGLLWLAVAVPLLTLIHLFLVRDRTMADQYPFSKQACSSLGRFAWYEVAYFLLYYSAWEFAFRGLLFFPLVNSVGLVPALAIQTGLSTLMHIGHPDTEIRAALVGGVVFGLIANATGSFVYPMLIHAGMGISHDIVQYRRKRRARSGTAV